MEITEAACVCDELCRLKEEEEEDGDKVSLGDSRVYRLPDGERARVIMRTNSDSHTGTV